MSRGSASGFGGAVRGAALVAVAATVWGVCPVRALASPEEGFSIGGGVGDYNLRITNVSQLGTALTTYSTHDTAWQAFAKLRFAPFLALEGQYMDLGTGSSFAGRTHITTRIDGWAPWLVATLPLGSVHSVVGPFELFIKGGEYFYHYHENYYTPVGAYHYVSDNYHQFVYGGGLGLVFVRHLDVRLEYDVLKIQHSDRSNALWLTAAFNF
jgi:Outer membrane protein beta-barrel domain